MLENILEYIVTDVYVQLWMYADAPPGELIRYRHMWREELLAQFDDPNDVPDCIIMKEPTMHVNGSNEFHYGNNKEPTVSYKEMSIIWGERDAHAKEDASASELFRMNRKTGPSLVKLTGVKKWHDHGLIHRRRGDAIICNQATFTWAKNGTYLRADGPYHISLRGYQASGDKGEVDNMRLGSLVPSWATMNNRRLPQITVRDVIQKNGLTVDLLAFGSVFPKPEDELIFLTEIAE